MVKNYDMMLPYLKGSDFMDKKDVYYLVVEARPKEFMPIDINILEKTYGYQYNSIENIDMFTKKYTYEEIMNLILINNLLPENFLNGSLCIINDKNFRFKVLTKEDNLSIDEFFIENVNDKIIMNKFYNIFLKYVKEDELINEMKVYINAKNIVGILNVLYKTSYINLRTIYFYIEKINKDKIEKRILKND